MHKIKLENGKFKFVESYTGLDGKRHRVSVTKNNQTRATEKQAYQELQEKINNKLNKENHYRKTSWYIEKFLEYKKNTVSEGTYELYSNALKLLPKDIIISNLTRTAVENILIKNRVNLSPNTLVVRKTSLNIFFKYIKEYHHKNFDLKVNFKLNKEEKIKELQKIKYIETHKIREVLDSIDNEEIRDMATIQLYTGLRIGELTALTKEDIDIENKTLSISKNRLRDRFSVSAPKTISSVRKIEVNEITLNLLLKYASSKNFIFYKTKESYLTNYAKFNLTSHMFRHTHVVLLIESGVPIKVISSRLGHANISTTLNIYTHVTEHMKIDLKNKLENLGTF